MFYSLWDFQLPAQAAQGYPPFLCSSGWGRALLAFLLCGLHCRRKYCRALVLACLPACLQGGLPGLLYLPQKPTKRLITRQSRGLTGGELSSHPKPTERPRDLLCHPLPPPTVFPRNALGHPLPERKQGGGETDLFRKTLRLKGCRLAVSMSVEKTFFAYGIFFISLFSGSMVQFYCIPCIYYTSLFLHSFPVR